MEEDNAANKKVQDDNIAVKKWNAVALWKFDQEQDTCAICRYKLQEQWELAMGVAPS
jgi:hypothetical protein